MSKEEKKAIDEFKKELRLAKNIDDITTRIRNEYAEIIVEVIEKQQKEIEFYSKQELGYIAGYQDGKNHKQTAISLKAENAQQELFQREIARYKDKIEKQQKEIERLKEINDELVKLLNE